MFWEEGQLVMGYSRSQIIDDNDVDDKILTGEKRNFALLRM